MELIDGVTLWDILSQHGRTTPESALVVLYGSLLGLAAAHARGVVHRDFKPRNVLVNAYGASKLTDFGIAARAGSPTVPSGSVAYAPPEQFDGGPASPASDVYAATATFYECLAGRPPFTGTTMESVIWQHHSAEVPMDPVPEPLRPIVARGMAKDPGYRPSDAAALAAGLRAAAFSAYGPDWERRGRWYLGEAAVVLAALWPSTGIPALHASSMEQVHLSQGAQHAHGVATAHQPATRAGLHRWHLRHVLHRDHLAHLRATRAARGARTASRAGGHLRTVTVAVTTAAVIAAGLTVEATSRSPAGPGTAAQPAVAVYSVAAAPATIPITLTGIFAQANGNTYTLYAPAGATQGPIIDGKVQGGASGEVARLYAQRFPYTSPPAPVASFPLNPVGGMAEYSFTLPLTLATRYQVKVMQNAAAVAPLASSAVKTAYIIDNYRYYYSDGHQAFSSPSCTGLPVVCTDTIAITVYAPPSALQTEMSEPKYLYLGYAGTQPGAGNPMSLRLDPAAVISAPVRVADNAYQVTVSYTVNVKADGPNVYPGFCAKQAEGRDGVGLPVPSACGAARLSGADTYAFGGLTIG
jgi:hypothetical protein